MAFNVPINIEGLSEVLVGGANTIINASACVDACVEHIKASEAVKM